MQEHHVDVRYGMSPNIPDDWLYSPSTWGCACAMFMTGILHSAAGIGGGGVVVSVLMVFGKLDPHTAVPMSKAVVFAGATISSLLNMRKKANSGASLIDYDIAAAVVPMALSGTMFGVWANSRVPGEVIVIILLATLFVTTFTTAKKYLEQLQYETANCMNVLSCGRGRPEDESPGIDGPTPLVTPKQEEVKSQKQPKSMSDGATSLLFLLLVTVILGGVVHERLSTCHMSKLAFSEDGCDDPLLWFFFRDQHKQFLGGANGMYLAAFPLVLPAVMCSIAVFIVLLAAYAMMKPELLSFSIMGFITGVLAGMVGIGGGLIFSPFAILMGVDPHVAVATSTFCVIFTSTSTTVQYALMGRLFFPLAILFGLANQIASYLGTMLMHYIQERHPNKNSYVTGVVLAAVALSAGMTLLKLKELTQKDE